MEIELAECQRVIGYHFANPTLLEIALTHSSLRSPDRECNERLEFLGDSVLGLVITEELYRLLPDQEEGELTRIKSAVVSRSALFRTSTRLGLARFAEFARGVSRRDELPVSVTANLVEAVIGAIYLDAGYYPAREFVLRHLGNEIEDILNDRGAKNYKSLLQHEVQQGANVTPTYRTIEEGGPDHRKQFVVAAVIRGQEWGRASGANKKEAEQEAARRALEAWERRGRGRRRRHADEGPARHREEPRRPIPAEADAERGPERRPPLGEPERPPPRAIAAEPDVEPVEDAAPARLPAPGPSRAPAPRAPLPRAPAPAPPPPRAAPVEDGFAVGIPDVRPAAPPRGEPRAPAAPVPVIRVDPKRRAPVPASPPPGDDEGGFDSGL
jgi:ribonuclease-3